MTEEEWQKVYEGGGAHLKRVIEMYEELGMEIKLEEVSLSECEKCKKCYEIGQEKLYRIYVKKAHGRIGAKLQY